MLGQVCLFHHAPRRTDDALDEIAAQHADGAIPVFAARDGLTVRLASRESPQEERGLRQ